MKLFRFLRAEYVTEASVTALFPAEELQSSYSSLKSSSSRVRDGPLLPFRGRNSRFRTESITYARRSREFDAVKSRRPSAFALVFYMLTFPRDCLFFFRTRSHLVILGLVIVSSRFSFATVFQFPRTVDFSISSFYGLKDQQRFV